MLSPKRFTSSGCTAAAARRHSQQKVHCRVLSKVWGTHRLRAHRKGEGDPLQQLGYPLEATVVTCQLQIPRVVLDRGAHLQPGMLSTLHLRVKQYWGLGKVWGILLFLWMIPNLSPR